MTLVILAAGLGRRFGGSKQTVAVGPDGEWLVDYSIYDAWRAGFRDVVLIIRPGAQPDFDAVRDRWRDRVAIRFAEQRPDDLPAGHTPGGRTKPWGTGHALLSARDAVAGPFAVINADDFYGRDAYALAAAAMPAAAAGEATIVGMRLQDTLSPHGPVTRAIVEARDGRVERITEVSGIEGSGMFLPDASASAQRGLAGLFPEENREKKTLPTPFIVSMNFWVYPAAIFGALGQALEGFLAAHGRSPDAELLLPDVVNTLVSQGRLTVRLVTAPGPWLGLTHAADHERVRAGLSQLAADGTYPAPAWGD